MQIGGLGNSHSTSDHHVTNCIHDHRDAQKDSGAMAMKASAAMEASAAKSELQQEGLFSLSAWLKSTLGNSKGFLLNFWEGGQAVTGSPEGSSTVISGTEESQAGSQAAVHTENSGMVPVAASEVQAVMQPNTMSNGSYVSAEATKNQKRTLRQRARDYFRNMSGRSDGKRSQSFSGIQTKKSFFQTKRERPGEEELRRKSRYRRDTVEINVARIEDNYLMDSYDRKGEYSRLTTKK